MFFLSILIKKVKKNLTGYIVIFRIAQEANIFKNIYLFYIRIFTRIFLFFNNQLINYEKAF